MGGSLGRRRLMTASEAKVLAREWAVERADELPGVAGAFLLGSLCLARDGEPFPDTSDVDVCVAMAGEGHDELTEVEGEFRKQDIRYKGLTIETGYASITSCWDHHGVLESPSWAPAFRTRNALLDPTGVLGKTHEAVRVAYAAEGSVRARCANQRRFVLWALERAARVEKPLPGCPDEILERVVWLLFPGLAGAAGIPCIAELGGPTFRRALPNCGRALAAYGMQEVYEELLSILGASCVTVQQVSAALAELGQAFDLAVAFSRTRFYGDFMFHSFMREKVLAGAQELISAGFYREAMLFLAVVRTRAQNALENDAPSSTNRTRRDTHRGLMADLGIQSGADISRKAERLRELLPAIMNAAETIISRSPGVQHA